MSVCFLGEFLNCQSRRRGADIVTTIYAQSGIEDLSTITHSRTWRGTSVRSAVIELARRFPNVTVDEKDIVGIDGYFSADKGWSTSGLVMESLDNLATEFGFNWSVDDGRFRATADGKPMSIVADVEGNNLIDVGPFFATPLQEDHGVSFRCVFNSNIRPHEVVNIKSSLASNKRYNGEYMVHHVSHTLDSHADAGHFTQAEVGAS